MMKKDYFNKSCLFIVFVLVSVMSYSYAFAGWTERGGHRARELVKMGHQRYAYHDGRFYKPGWFGFEFSIRVPPMGVIVSSLPFGYRTIVVENTPYYYYDNVYYKHCSAGYVVVQQPAIISNAGFNIQSQLTNRETVTIKISDLNGGSIAITLVRFSNGFLGPKGEFYPQLPSVEQLKFRYR